MIMIQRAKQRYITHLEGSFILRETYNKVYLLQIEMIKIIDNFK